MTDELKPCPFCGGHAEIHTRKVRKFDDDGNWIDNEFRYVVRCKTCNANSRLSFSREDALSLWNRRAK